MSKNTQKGLRVPYGLAVHNREEEERVLAVLREHRTIIGKETEEFETSIAKLFGKKYGVMVNSGSSANTLAIDLLNLPPGFEVITPLLTFSTTLAPIVKKGLIPVFADVEISKYIIDTKQIENLITKKTKALVIPLLLGNVPDMEKLRILAKKYKLSLVEDSCDTLGATFDRIPTGKFSDISTTSFYGSHIITAGGNGGMLLVDKDKWRDRAKVLRGWGRSSSIFKDSEAIGKRFNRKIGNTQYDAKFIFEEIGYNFMPMELGAAFGNAQIKKLPSFKKIRERNFRFLLNFFKQYEKYFVLPKQDSRIQTQWLAFPLTIKKSAPFSRIEIVIHLEENNIQTRPIFTGNALLQPAFKDIKYRRISNSYPVTNEVMERGFVIGCHQGLTEGHLKKIVNVCESFLNKYA